MIVCSKSQLHLLQTNRTIGFVYINERVSFAIVSPMHCEIVIRDKGGMCHSSLSKKTFWAF